MKERPILFSGPMVRAILEGRKTQTRRIMKPQPSKTFLPQIGEYQRTLVDRKDGEQFPDPVVRFGASDENEDYPCPYGQPGDRLWVRETFTESSSVKGFAGVHYRADDTMLATLCDDGGAGDPVAIGRRLKVKKGPCWRPPWKPSIFMPRWASRITLEVTAVRVERLQACSESNAKAEGLEECQDDNYWGWKMPNGEMTLCASYAYALLWESINGAGSWAKNPWVWVIEFRRIAP